MLKHQLKNKTSNLMLASAGEDVRLWQLPDLALHSVKNGKNSNTVHCACSPNGQLVAYAHEDEGINIASITDDTFPVIEIPTQCGQSSVTFNGNSRYILSGGADCVVNVWDIKTRATKRTFKDHENPVTYCIFNYNDNIIASASDHGEILLTNVQSGLTSDPLAGSDDTQAVRCLGYSFFARSLMASISDSGSLCLWDTKEKKLLKKFTDHNAPGTGLSFSPLNDMLLCSTGLDKRLVFYDVSGKKTVKTINTEGPMTCCDFFNDGCTVAVGSASGHIFLFDLRHGSTPVKVISAHKTSVRGVSFQKVAKENKSPRKPVEESKVASTNSTIATPVNTTNEMDKDDIEPPPLPPSLPSSYSRNTPIHKNISAQSEVPPPSPVINQFARESSSTSFNNERQSSLERPPLPPKASKFDNAPISLGSRENSTLALNKLISMNQPPLPEPVNVITSIPPKAAKLIGEDIFSPIQTDGDRSSTLPRKLKANRQKSLGKNHKVDMTGEAEEPDRPTYSRSKSGLSRLSILAKSMEDINTVKKPEKEKKEKDKDRDRDREKDSEDINDGKKGLLGFKSPFKKNKRNYNRHSDESETSSLDSLNLEERSLNLRGKKDRLSDRSNDSGSRVEGIAGFPTGSRQNVDTSRQPFDTSRQIDTSQLLADIQLSLANQNNMQNGLSKSPSAHSGSDFNKHNAEPEVYRYEDYASEMAEQKPSHIQVEFIQQLIDDAMEENRTLIHGDMVNLQVEMLRQMEIQKAQIRQMIQQSSINGELLVEIERLRAENDRLRTKY